MTNTTNMTNATNMVDMTNMVNTTNVMDMKNELQTVSAGLRLEAGMASKCGHREKNEDAARISSDGKLFAVADGIGGAPMGDVMSAVACNAAVDAFAREGKLFDAFDAASEATVTVKNLLRPVAQASGTTLLLAVCEEDQLQVAWVGDTVAILLREGELSFIAAPDNVDNTNQLGSALGYHQETLPLYSTKELRAGDRVLLCTDGVWSTLTGDRMVEVLSMQANAAWMAQLLTKEAAEGGYDNATAIVLTVEPGGLRDGDDDEGECCEELPSAPCTPSYPALGYN